jgi:ArsR family transcriptional regulator
MTCGIDEATAGRIADLLKVMANHNRLRILYLLAAAERSVSEIEQLLGIRQPTLSQQLGELRNAEVVATRREHKVVFYSLVDPRVRELLDAFDDVLVEGRPRHRRRGQGLGTSARTQGQAAQFAHVGGDR